MRIKRPYTTWIEKTNIPLCSHTKIKISRGWVKKIQSPYPTLACSWNQANLLSIIVQTITWMTSPNTPIDSRFHSGDWPKKGLWYHEAVGHLISKDLSCPQTSAAPITVERLDVEKASTFDSDSLCFYRGFSCQSCMPHLIQIHKFPWKLWKLIFKIWM